MTFFRTKAGSRVEVGLPGESLAQPGSQEAEPRQEMVRMGIRGRHGGRKEGDKVRVFSWGHGTGSSGYLDVGRERWEKSRQHLESSLGNWVDGLDQGREPRRGAGLSRSA